MELIFEDLKHISQLLSQKQIRIATGTKKATISLQFQRYTIFLRPIVMDFGCFVGKFRIFFFFLSNSNNIQNRDRR